MAHNIEKNPEIWGYHLNRSKRPIKLYQTTEKMGILKTNMKITYFLQPVFLQSR
jgi:hypothetical protein